jgi:hypothetical protein
VRRAGSSRSPSWTPRSPPERGRRAQPPDPTRLVPWGSGASDAEDIDAIPETCFAGNATAGAGSAVSKHAVVGSVERLKRAPALGPIVAVGSPNKGTADEHSGNDS